MREPVIQMKPCKQCDYFWGRESSPVPARAIGIKLDIVPNLLSTGNSSSPAENMFGVHRT